MRANLGTLCCTALPFTYQLSDDNDDVNVNDNSGIVKRGYMHSLLLEYFKRFCLTDKIEEKYSEQIISSSHVCLNTVPLFFCDMNNVMGINDFKPCSVKITTITSSFYICINKPPLPAGALMMRILLCLSCINTRDIDDIEWIQFMYFRRQCQAFNSNLWKSTTFCILGG